MFRLNCNFFKLFLKINNIKYGEKLKMVGIPIIYRFKDSNINIGHGCTINSSFLSNLVGLYQRTIIIARDGGEIIIGNNVGISGSTIYSLDEIDIGNNTVIGANSKIIDNDFHPLDPLDRVEDDRDKIKSKKISIGENVFIGTNSIILKGTELKDNCVVGAGSVVSGKFSKNSIIGGNPAKVIGKVSN